MLKIIINYIPINPLYPIIVNINKNLNKLGTVDFLVINNPIFNGKPINVDNNIIKNKPNSILGISREH